MTKGCYIRTIDRRHWFRVWFEYARKNCYGLNLHHKNHQRTQRRRFESISWEAEDLESMMRKGCFMNHWSESLILGMVCVCVEKLLWLVPSPKIFKEHNFEGLNLSLGRRRIWSLWWGRAITRAIDWRHYFGNTLSMCKKIAVTRAMLCVFTMLEPHSTHSSLDLHDHILVPREYAPENGNTKEEPTATKLQIF